MNLLKIITICAISFTGANAIAGEMPANNANPAESSVIYECKGISDDQDSHYAVIVSATSEEVQDHVDLKVVEGWGDGEELDQDDLNRVPVDFNSATKILSIQQSKMSAFGLIEGLRLKINQKSLYGTLKMDFSPSGKRQQSLNVVCIRK